MQMHFSLLMIFSRKSLDCKLVPVHYREYEYGLLYDLKNEPSISAYNVNNATKYVHTYILY